MANASTSTSRDIVRVIRGRETSDGAGVRLTRVIGSPELSDLDPFLMLDEFGSEEASDYIGGFPDHPHRGFETVTYLLAGRMCHWDNHGHSGIIESGGAQWMTAGRGIIHSEMPEQQEGLLRGFQLWINLPARDKMGAPRYQEFAPSAIPTIAGGEGVTVRVLAGKVGEVKGPVIAEATDPLYIDVTLAPGASFAQPLRRDDAAFVYVFEGASGIGDGESRAIARGELAVLGPGETVRFRAGDQGARFLLVAGRPINEPVAKHGPFVMNTREEILQAFDDLRRGRF
jgi:redox-sensitive bicupin YhaK (pirin superfamily)